MSLVVVCTEFTTMSEYGNVSRTVELLFTISNFSVHAVDAILFLMTIHGFDCHCSSI